MPGGSKSNSARCYRFRTYYLLIHHKSFRRTSFARRCSKKPNSRVEAQSGKRGHLDTNWAWNRIGCILSTTRSNCRSRRGRCRQWFCWDAPTHARPKEWRHQRKSKSRRTEWSNRYPGGTRTDQGHHGWQYRLPGCSSRPSHQQAKYHFCVIDFGPNRVDQ